MSKPLVSVIIPAYNAALLIRETIQSVLSQTYNPLEIIVVDDGSKDNTKEMLADYVQQEKIRYMRQENQGQAVARLNGLKTSRGDFISFIDADDLIAPDKIALQVQYMQTHPDCGVCYSDIVHFWHHKPDILLRKNLNYYSGFIFDNLIKGNFIQVMTALIRRQILEKYGMPGEEFRRSDDWYLWLNLAYHGTKFCFIDRALAFQRRQKQGTLSDQKTYFKETAETNIAIYEYFKKILSPREAGKYNIDNLINFWQFRCAIGYVILRDGEGARKALKDVLPSLKKIFFQILLFILPTKLFGEIIFALREFRKRRSFKPLNDKSIKMPIYGK